jgi:hypothetical protein
MRTDDSSAHLAEIVGEAGDYDPEQGMVPRRQSFVRISVGDPYDDDPMFAEPPTLKTERETSRALANDQLNLTVNLLHLTRLLQAEPSGMLTPSAASTIGSRIGDIEDIRDAIDAVLSVKNERLERLLAPGAALSAYLKGLYLYLEGIVEAFEDALSGAAALDGAALRFQLAAASQFYFDGLMHAVRFDLLAADTSFEARAATEQLFFATTFVHEQILGLCAAPGGR